MIDILLAFLFGAAITPLIVGFLFLLTFIAEELGEIFDSIVEAIADWLRGLWRVK